MLRYISGPVSGVDNFEDNFIQAKKAIEASGHTSLSILDCSAFKHDRFKWSDCMKFCIEMLEKCDCILMMNGWRTSVGATIERAWAEKIGIPVYYEVEGFPPF